MKWEGYQFAGENAVKRLKSLKFLEVNELCASAPYEQNSMIIVAHYIFVIAYSRAFFSHLFQERFVNLEEQFSLKVAYNTVLFVHFTPTKAAQLARWAWFWCKKEAQL